LVTLPLTTIEVPTLTKEMVLGCRARYTSRWIVKETVPMSTTVAIGKIGRPLRV